MALPAGLIGARLLALCVTAAVHLVVAATLASVLDYWPDSASDRGATLTVVTLQARPPVAAQEERDDPAQVFPPDSSSRVPQPAGHSPAKMAGAEIPSQAGSSDDDRAAVEAGEPAEIAIPRPDSRTRPTAVESGAELDRYRTTVWRQIDEHRPRGVTMRGTAVIRFRLSPDGGLIDAAVSRTSGSILLDKVTLRSVRQAAPFPRVPPGIPEAQLTFEIAINIR